MRGSTGPEIRTINERFERTERAKKLAVELERVSACLANAERLAEALAVEDGVDILGGVTTATEFVSECIKNVQKFITENTAV